MAAAQSLVDHALVKSSLHNRRVTKASRDDAHPVIVEFYLKFHKELAARGFPFYAHVFYRDWQKQYDLKRLGRSKAGPGASPHNWGMAVDIVHSTLHWELGGDYDEQRRKWDVIGTIGKEVARKMNVKITWGGDWNFWDPAHWELTDWRAYRDGKPMPVGSMRSALATAVRHFEQHLAEMRHLSS